MKITRANVAEYAENKGYISIQIDAIPEGFSWFSESEIVIKGSVPELRHVGHLIGFTPNYDWDKKGAMFIYPIVVHSDATEDELALEIENVKRKMVDCYKENIKTRDAK